MDKYNQSVLMEYVPCTCVLHIATVCMQFVVC